MPPLNRLLEDQENNVWRRPTSPHGSFSALPDSPWKPATPDVTAGRSGRRARFSETNQVHTVISRESYSEQEIEDCWSTASEFASFRQDVCTTVYLLKTDPNRVDDVEFTMRGVEHRMEEGANRRCFLRYRAKTAVFDEQDFQSGLGERCVEREVGGFLKREVGLGG